MQIGRATERRDRVPSSGTSRKDQKHYPDTSEHVDGEMWLAFSMIPALLTSTSSLPNVSITLAAPASTCSSLATSITTPVARLSLASISLGIGRRAIESRRRPLCLDVLNQ